MSAVSASYPAPATPATQRLDAPLGGPRDLPPPATRRARPGHDGSRSPLRRRHLVAVVGAISITLVLIVFANALSAANKVNEQAATLRVQNAVLQERLAAGRREVELVKSDAFVRLQARAYGFGESGERPFGLTPDAPPPPSITPLGAEQTVSQPAGPLDAWLELLFGP